jgi:hypothetical protein
VAAKPYASWSLIFHGELSEQVNAVPPSQPDFVSGSESTLSFLSHVSTGCDTEAFPDHAQLGLQQSQYLVDVPVPEAARVPTQSVETTNKPKLRSVRILYETMLPLWSVQGHQQKV